MLIGRHIHHGNQIIDVAVTPCSALGCLNEAVDALQETVGHFAVELAQDAFLVPLDRFGQIGHWRKLGPIRPPHRLPQIHITLLLRKKFALTIVRPKAVPRSIQLCCSK